MVTIRLSKLRKLEAHEYDVLSIFMYNAVTRYDEEFVGMDIVKTPEYRIYIEDFGKEDDVALVWEIEGQIAGLAWARLFNEEDATYGYVAADVPEVTLSVLAGYNERTIGKELLEILSNELRLMGYNKVSTSLENKNECKDIYDRVGFIKECDQKDDRTLYVKTLN